MFSCIFYSGHPCNPELIYIHRTAKGPANVRSSPILECGALKGEIFLLPKLFNFEVGRYLSDGTTSSQTQQN